MEFDGKKLRKIRTDRGVSQGQLSRMIGYNRVVITRLEAGTYGAVSLGLVSAIATALECEFGDLLTQTGVEGA